MLNKMKKLSHVRDLAFIRGTFILNFMKLSVNDMEAEKLTDSKMVWNDYNKT